MDLAKLEIRSGRARGAESVTPKQKLFIKEYLVDSNATRAAISAGYSARTAYAAGSRLLKNVEVQAELDSLTAKRTEKLDISADYVLQTIRETVERCSQGTPVFDREGKETGEWKFDAFAVLKGCELLGKYHKLFTDKVEVAGLDALPDILKKARERVKSGDDSRPN